MISFDATYPTRIPIISVLLIAKWQDYIGMNVNGVNGAIKEHAYALIGY